MLPKVGSNAFSRRASNPSAYLLDHDHQRIRKQKRPGDSESELGSGLRIGGDSARIVVSDAPVMRPGPSIRISLGLLGATTPLRDFLFFFDSAF